MKTPLHLTLAVLIFSLCTAFSPAENDGLDLTFGVSQDDPSNIELQLNKDYTFTYRDLSVSARPINVQGTYRINHNKVQLIAEDGQTNFHHRWTISPDKLKARSRRWLNFYTLSKL